MMVLRALLFTVEVVCSLLLIGIILIQKAKGGGLGLAFGGGGTESLFGSRAGNVLTKATVILAIVFMANTVALAILFARSHDATLMDTHREPAPATAQPEPQPQPTGVPVTEAPPAVEAVPMPADAPPLEVTPTLPAMEEVPADVQVDPVPATMPEEN